MATNFTAIRKKITELEEKEDRERIKYYVTLYGLIPLMLFFIILLILNLISGIGL